MRKAQSTITLAASIILLIGAVLLIFSIINFVTFITFGGLILIINLIVNYAISLFGKKNKVKEEVSRNPVLYKTRSVFPFQFFPDTYIIQEKNFFIIRKTFFATGWTEMLPIKDIASVRMYSGPFFASVSILRKVLPQTSFELRDLWKNDALKIKELLDALIMKEAKLIHIPEQITPKEKTKILISKVAEKEVAKEI